MTSRDFCFWLQGFFELRATGGAAPAGMSFEQTEMVRRHLALVFKHEIDPSMGGPAKQAELDKAHDGALICARPKIEESVMSAVGAPSLLELHHLPQNAAHLELQIEKAGDSDKPRPRC